VIVELRQYTLRPGQHQVLSELFERALADGQEAVGMRLIGWFHDLDDPDRFVWLRSFPDMESRAQALHDFYGGPVWAEHREAANATMVDSDDVLLLRSAREGAGVALPSGAEQLVLSIHQFPRAVDDETVERLERRLGPAWVTLITEESENNFPALPIREGEHVVVRLSSQADPGAPEILRLQR
jgi:NIPSNAP